MSKKDENKTPAAEPEILRKITNKHVMGGLTIPTDKETPLYRLYGVIRKYKVDQSEHGPYVKFSGEFKAVRYADGKEFVAPNMIVVNPMDDVLAAMYEKERERLNKESGGDDSAFVQCQFAIEIGVKPSATPTGYEWTSKSLIKMQKNEAIAGIEAQIGDLPRLTAD